MQRVVKPKATTPRLAEPAVGDRVALLYRGKLKHGVLQRTTEHGHCDIRLDHEPGWGALVISTDLARVWKVKEKEQKP